MTGWESMMGGGWGWGWMGVVGMLSMVLFWVVLVAGAVWVVTALTRPREPSRGPGAPDASALRILEERLARGEIDVEEFRARRAAIQIPAR